MQISHPLRFRFYVTLFLLFFADVFSLFLVEKPILYLVLGFALVTFEKNTRAQNLGALFFLCLELILTHDTVATPLLCILFLFLLISHGTKKVNLPSFVPLAVFGAILLLQVSFYESYPIGQKSLEIYTIMKIFANLLLITIFTFDIRR